MIALLRIAGLVHLIIVGANFALPKILDYDGNLAKVSPMIRQIFLVHHAYIVAIVSFFGVLCLFFARDLAGGTRLGSVVCAFMALFWFARLPVQFFFYDAEMRRQHRLAHYAFSFALASVTAVLAAAAIRGLL